VAGSGFRQRVAIGAAALSLLCLGAAPAVGMAAPHRAAAPQGILNVGIQSDFVTLDPSQSSAYVDRQGMINIYDGLVQFNPQMKVVPDLATWKISDGGRVYTLYLRHGVMFQDNTPFNAAAVVFNLDRDRAPSSPRSSNLAVVSSVKAVGDYTVVITLKQPFSPFLDVLAGRSGMMASPTAVRKWGKAFGSHPVGTGPFEFVKWIPNDYVELKANPHYWQPGLPKLAEIIYHPITDPTTELDTLKSNGVQLIDTLAAKDLKSAEADPNIKVSTVAGLGWYGIYVNTKSGPLSNLYVRQALQYAIDRQTINRIIYYGTGTPAYTQFPPAEFAYDPGLTIPYSPGKAKALLKQAGYGKGLTLTVQGDNDPVTSQELQLIKIMLAKVGITLNIQLLDFGTLLNNELKENYQLLLLGWSGRVDPDENSYQFDVTGGSLNQTGFGNSQVDAYLNDARLATSTATRREDYWKAAKLLDYYSPYVFLVFLPDYKAWSTKVHGFIHYPDGVMRLWDVSLG
jgi:peptide/nickel transport system substrate-binding protein